MINLRPRANVRRLTIVERYRTWREAGASRWRALYFAALPPTVYYHL